jgi:diaminohydroxyphosphoribosylaminopyrimidine deaminase/5-amino-6-(5-phosphoribosylamino)uracil reductase
MTSPNPMVGAVLLKGGKIIGRGWHRHAGGPHAEIEALRDAHKQGHKPKGATLYVTLEPCCTHGRTPPCTDAIIAAGIKRIVIGAVDPNPKHAGKGFRILQRGGIEVFGLRRHVGALESGDMLPHSQLAGECSRLNEAFNHWIVHRTPFVTVKAAMTLDGKIATASGESKWITSEKARAHGMKLRRGSDAVLVGINTIIADNPSLTVRTKMEDGRWKMGKPVRRIILDSMARTPLTAKVARDKHAALTTLVISARAPKNRVAALAKRVKVLVAPVAKSASGNSDKSRARDKSRCPQSAIDLRWLLKKLGAENVTSLLVEGGGEVNASFLLGGFAQRVAFFYAPKILGGRDSRKAVAGEGAKSLAEVIRLRDVEWKRLGPDLLLVARLESKL